MKFVNSKSDIRKNLEYLINNEGGATLELIRNGRSILPFKFEGQLYFAPSRFLGYLDNSTKKHENNSSKHGGATNNQLKLFLGAKASNPKMESAFKNFVKSKGKEAPDRKRTFWPVFEDFSITKTSIESDINELKSNKDLKPTEIEALVKARLGQGKFRTQLGTRWRNKCAVTGCSIADCLRASHIKPWRDANNSERLDPNNGLLLTANIDALFDRGLISFDKEGQVIVHSSILDKHRPSLGLPQGNFKIKTSAELEKYMKFHRTKVMRK